MESTECHRRHTSALALAAADSLGVLHQEPFLPASECERLVDAVERHAQQCGGWPLLGDYEGATSRHVQLEHVPSLHPWLQRHVVGAIVPRLARLFSLDGGALLRPHCRVVKYEADVARPAHTIALHSDGTPFSFILSLNHAFAGGGTYVRCLDRAFSPPVGSALLFCGRWLHCGLPVRSGVRYVLAGFVEIDGVPADLEEALCRVRRLEERLSVVPRLCADGEGLRRRIDGGGTPCALCGTVGRAGRTCHSCAKCGFVACTRCLYARAGPAACEGGEGSWPWRGALPLLVEVERCEWSLSATTIELRPEEKGRAALTRHGVPVSGAAQGEEGQDGRGERHALFVDDLTVPDGASVRPGQVFTKVWLLSQGVEVGAMHWPEEAVDESQLVRDDVDAETFENARWVGHRVLPGAVCLVGRERRGRGEQECGDAGDEDDSNNDTPRHLVEVKVELVAPEQPGRYRVYFRLVHRNSLDGFGDRLWADFVVVSLKQEFSD
ncbi:hypothetical protein AB1Y20_013080 [Prymnesium parvum]|uniref:Fe2OG dioxygenase domain-containing protein n=1 Tax=Prymnesium parvum TaxID=97485 RepID=A0AB34IKM3_PRYPA